MKSYKKKIVYCCLLSICLLPALRVQAQFPAAKEWVDVPVVVNIIDGLNEIIGG